MSEPVEITPAEAEVEAEAADPVEAAAEEPDINKTIESFLVDALKPDRESLVVWPEEQPLTLVERAAVNLATSAEGTPDLANLIPADVKAAVCPQGAPTLPVIHALTAAAALEQARLVCELDKAAETPASPEHEKARTQFKNQLRKVENLHKKRMSAEHDYRRKIDQIPVLEQRIVDSEEHVEEAHRAKADLVNSMSDQRELVDFIVEFRTLAGMKPLKEPTAFDVKSVLPFVTKHRTEVTQIVRKSTSHRKSVERTLKQTQQNAAIAEQKLAEQQQECARKEQAYQPVKASYREAKDRYLQAKEALEGAGFFQKRKLEAALREAEEELRAAHRSRESAKQSYNLARTALAAAEDALETCQSKLAAAQDEYDEAMLDDGSVDLYQTHIDELEPRYKAAKDASDKLRNCDSEISRAEKARTAPERALSSNQSRLEKLQSQARNDGTFFLVDGAVVDALLAGSSTVEELWGAGAAAGLAAYDHERAELLRCAQELVAAAQ